MRKYIITGLVALLLVIIFTDPLRLILGSVTSTISYPATTSFPKDFLWGVSSSAYQTEGGDSNDWTEWEKANAKNLATSHTECSKNSQNNFCPEKTDPNNYISGQSDDSYNLYPEDIKLAQSLGVKAFRFSIEWSRVEPKQGVFDQEAIAHYQSQIKEIKTVGMEPFVTLWHWTLPIWFANKGGWCSSGAVADFKAYTQSVIASMGQDSTFWITLNEPQVYAGSPYVDGRPPGGNIFCLPIILNHMAKAHEEAYALIKQVNPNAQIGISQATINFGSSRTTTLSRLEEALARGANKYFINRIENYQDFIGINYFHGGLTFGYKKNYQNTSDLNWPLYPQGLYYVLQEFKNYHKPIYITENGLADASDTKRADYIKDILKSIAAARQSGIDVKGYFYWSLTDGFEWTQGFWPRFGLAAVDYKTQKRILRPSAWEYSKIIQENGF